MSNTVILYVIILFNISILLYNKTCLFSNQVTVISPTGADPGFLMRGFKWPKGGSFWYFYLNYHKNPHEIEIIITTSTFNENVTPYFTIFQ